MTASTRAGLAGAALLLPLALAACGAGGAEQPRQHSATEAIFTSVDAAPEAASETPTVTEVITTTSTQAPPETASPPDDTCANLPKDPRKQYETGTAPGRMPAADGSDYNFWIDNIDNHYDPCAPLSWIVFDGQLGDVNGPAGTAGSITDGVAFYSYGKPQIDMHIFGRVDSIQLVEDKVLEFTWSERTRSTAEGFTAQYTVRIQTQSGGIAATEGNVAEFYQRWSDRSGFYMLGTYD